MDLQSQQRVKDAAEKYGAETVVIILGSSDGESVFLWQQKTILLLIFVEFNSSQ